MNHQSGKSRPPSAEQAEFDALAGSWSTHELISVAAYLLKHLKGEELMWTLWMRPSVPCTRQTR